MNIDPQLQEIADKVEAGVRLDFDDGMLLSTHPDVLTVGQIANGLSRAAARQRHLLQPQSAPQCHERLRGKLLRSAPSPG